MKEVRSNWILTPHPGEAARLLNTSVAEVQANRFIAAQEICQRYGGVTVLKGAGTIIATLEHSYLADVGNPGLAIAGAGDVLSGVIGGLLAQGLSLEEAAVTGVCIHGKAADRQVEKYGMVGMLATDLITEVRSVINEHMHA